MPLAFIVGKLLECLEWYLVWIGLVFMKVMYYFPLCVIATDASFCVFLTNHVFIIVDLILCDCSDSGSTYMEIFCWIKFLALSEGVCSFCGYTMFIMRNSKIFILIKKAQESIYTRNGIHGVWFKIIDPAFRGRIVERLLFAALLFGMRKSSKSVILQCVIHERNSRAKTPSLYRIASVWNGQCSFCVFSLRNVKSISYLNKQ